MSLLNKKAWQRLAPDIQRQWVLLALTRHAEILAFPGISHFGRAFALHKLLGVARVATLVHGDVEHREQSLLFLIRGNACVCYINNALYTHFLFYTVLHSFIWLPGTGHKCDILDGVLLKIVGKYRHAMLMYCCVGFIHCGVSINRITLL